MASVVVAVAVVASATSACRSVVSGAGVPSVVIVTPAVAVAHTVVGVVWPVVAVVASAIPRASAVVPPRVAAAIYHTECRSTEVEVCAMRIAGINSEVPVAGIPVNGTEEV